MHAICMIYDYINSIRSHHILLMCAVSCHIIGHWAFWLFFNCQLLHHVNADQAYRMISQYICLQMWTTVLANLARMEGSAEIWMEITPAGAPRPMLGSSANCVSICHKQPSRASISGSLCWLSIHFMDRTKKTAPVRHFKRQIGSFEVEHKHTFATNTAALITQQKYIYWIKCRLMDKY